jgi:hypothetical protein
MHPSFVEAHSLHDVGAGYGNAWVLTQQYQKSLLGNGQIPRDIAIVQPHLPHARVIPGTTPACLLLLERVSPF